MVYKMIYAMLLTLLYDCKEWEVTLILSFYLQESEKECRKRLPLLADGKRMLFGLPVVSVDFLVPADMLVCVGEVA